MISASRDVLALAGVAVSGISILDSRGCIAAVAAFRVTYTTPGDTVARTLATD
jgi:hypothetical protein